MQNRYYLVKYITHYRLHYSRYEIDQFLLSEGCSPEALDFAWEHVEAGSSLNSFAKNPSRNKILVISYILSTFIVAFLSISSFYLWPFILHRTNIGYFLICISLLKNIFIIRELSKGNYNKVGINMRFLLSLVVFLVEVITILIILWSGTNYILKETASTSNNSQNYHFIVLDYCDFCNLYHDATLYKCDFWNLLCTEAGKINSVIVSENYKPKTNDEIIHLNRNRPTELLVNPETKSVVVIQDGQIRYTFYFPNIQSLYLRYT